MSKLTKFFKHPVMFFEDAQKNKKLKEGKPKIFVVGFSTWKTYLRTYFSEYDLIFLPKDIKKNQFDSQYRKKILNLKDSCQVFIWGFKAPEYILGFLREEKIPTKFVEDGFVRSVKLGATQAPPMSLCLDSKTPYFDATRASDLECLLNDFDFSKHPNLLDEARECIRLLLDKGVSKYNNSKVVDVRKIYGIKNKKRVLVLGQVEDDASIMYGCSSRLTNNDVVRLAVKENPDAQVIYKPHPDVMNGHRPKQSDPLDVADISLVLKKDIPLANSFDTIDHVYTITSLGGFEALLRGIKVTTIGCPFYSGWGVTDNRQENKRRHKQRSVEEIFAIAYCYYAKYFDDESGEQVSLPYVIDKIERGLKKSPALKPVKNKNDALRNSNKAEQKASTLPSWFNPNTSESIKKAISDDKPIYLYMPWIAEHSNALVERIEHQSYVITPFDLIRGDDPFESRRDILKFAAENPDLYRKMVLRKLVPIKNKVHGFIFTFDWAPVMRIISSACEELNIQTILIPHESVFVDKDKYYWCPKSKASLPKADITLGWGQLQKEIFLSRGYPKDKFISVGAPKFDSYYNYEAQLNRNQFCRLFGLDPSKKIILFASQHLDSQLDKVAARKSQCSAIRDAIEVCKNKDLQLLIRLPPSKENVLDEKLREEILALDFVAVDDAQCYLVKPEEAVYHSEMVTSINSTMLFEGVLLRKASFSMKYIEFKQIWEKVGIPFVKDKDQLFDMVELVLSGKYSLPKDGLDWAGKMFGVGSFDGKASERIKEFLSANLKNITSNNPPQSAYEKIISSEVIDVIGMPSSDVVWAGPQKNVLAMLKARDRVNSSSGLESLPLLAAVDIFVQWGITDKPEKLKQKAAAKALGRPIVYLEDGFIRSLDIGLSGEPALSIIVDDITSYYDATKASRLETLLNDDVSISAEQTARCQALIDLIVGKKITKYNHAPTYPVKIGKNSKKILLVDQRYGDQSVVSGLADESSFDRMLHDAVNEGGDVDVIIKQHPDSIKGGKASYFNNDKLAFSKHMENVFVVDYDVNPFVLFDMVDEVRVVTSGMGFEALMAGKKVSCYGAPFYSGWGVTNDKVKVARRSSIKEVSDIFYYSYILLSRYYNPATNMTCELEELIDYIDTVKMEQLK